MLDYFEDRYLNFRCLSPASAANVRRSLRQFSVWLGHKPALCELSDELVSRFVAYLSASFAPKTAHNKRGDVLGVWADAYAWDKTGSVQQPRRVRDVRVPDPEPQSWSAAEVALLVIAARGIGGTFYFGPPRALFLEALVRTAWETGLRRGDLWGLRLSNVGPDGTIHKTQSKTGVLICGQLEPETVALLLAIGRDPPLAWPIDPSALGYWMIRLRELAGLGDHGQLQRIRASAATDVAIRQPGKETAFLGHTNPKADVWYIDRKRLPRCAVKPVKLRVPRLKQGK